MNIKVKVLPSPPLPIVPSPDELIEGKNNIAYEGIEEAYIKLQRRILLLFIVLATVSLLEIFLLLYTLSILRHCKDIFVEVLLWMML